MRRGHGPGRRLVIGALATGAAFGVGPVRAQPAGGTLLVAGPPGGRIDRWADVIAPAIERNMPGRVSLDRKNAGGFDGVTGANQFQAWTEPDGTTALLVPGTATLSWLTGETRAKFNPAGWVALWAGLNTLVLVSRVTPAAGRPFRIARSALPLTDLPAALGLELLGVETVSSPPASADGAVLVGSPATLAAAAAAGMQPIMTFGLRTPEAGGRRNPSLGGIPSVFDLIGGRAPNELRSALAAVSLAAQLDVALVLPALTAASSVSLWRRACAALSREDEVQATAANLAVQIVAPGAVPTCTSGIVADQTTLLALRNWLSSRPNWHPT